MAVVEISRTLPQGASFAGLATRLVHTVLAWNDARQTRNALSKLSDQMLNDIGLSRHDVHSI